MVLEVQQRQLCWIGLDRKVRIAMLGPSVRPGRRAGFSSPTIPLNVGGAGAIQSGSVSGELLRGVLALRPFEGVLAGLPPREC